MYKYNMNVLLLFDKFSFSFSIHNKRWIVDDVVGWLKKDYKMSYHFSKYTKVTTVWRQCFHKDFKGFVSGVALLPLISYIPNNNSINLKMQPKNQIKTQINKMKSVQNSQEITWIHSLSLNSVVFSTTFIVFIRIMMKKNEWSQKLILCLNEI